MTDIPITANERKAQFTGNTGLGPFAFTFNILTTSDIRVIKNGTVLTLTSEYTVTTNANGTGSVTLTGSGNGTALISTDILTIIGNRQLARTSDYVQGGNLFAGALNEDLDSIVIMMQQLDEKVSRTMRIDAGDIAENLLLPDQNDRKGKYLAFNATTGDPEAGPTETDVVALAAITSDIALLADIQDGTTATNAITTVSGISSNVTTVAGISGNVTTVAGNTANINTVAADLAGVDDIGTVAGSIASVNTTAGSIGNVNTVASDLGGTDTIGTVATNIANVNTVAGISANVTTVAGISADVTAVVADEVDIGIVAADLTGSNTVGTVAGIAANVTTVAGISADVTTVAADGTDIGTVATNIANVNTVAGISGNVTTVAGISADVTAVAGDATDIGTVSANIANVNTVAGISANVTTVAGISADVTTVAGISADVVAAPIYASDAESARDQSQAARDTANLHKLAAEAAATSATNTAAALTGFDLDAIAASKAVTAVDVFVYDTSRDSDGGAWRKRTQHTSWYNETLNTATRGARREFPAVAVIVAEADKVTIYDGDDPALPMWMVFNQVGSGRPLLSAASGLPSSVSALNGIIGLGLKTGSVNDGQAGIGVINFISEVITKTNTAAANGSGVIGPLIDRNIGKNSNGVFPYGSAIANNTVNDVAMTVLPDAPIDPATGLPVPTIAVATAGGVSVIKDDGTVVDSNDTIGFTKITFSGASVAAWTSAARVLLVYDTYASDGFITSRDYDENGTLDIFRNATPATLAHPSAIAPSAIALGMGGSDADAGLFTIAESWGHVHTTSTYNTGWMNGAIKGAFLSDTDDTDLVASGIDDDFTGYADQAAATAAGYSFANSVTFDAATDAAVWSGTGEGQFQFDVASGFANGTNLIVEVVVSGATKGSLVFQNNFVTVPRLDGGGNIGTVAGTYSFSMTKNGGLRFASAGTFDGQIDNISVKLADADRSVNNRGLIVNGTVVRSPVATGAELVAYSGFSASNYLEQPYNSALDFGTGDFCVMGWVNGAGGNDLLDRSDASNTLRVKFSSDKVRVNIAGVNLDTPNTFIGGWKHITYVRKSGVGYIYGDGILLVSGSHSGNVGTGMPTRVGNRYDGTAPFGGSMALWRISATAPTAEQIKKIYEDEKFLFQDNAACTLYGASDAVTALAHDPDTGLLHVGTSAGRSVFQGLRRVANTTTAVGTAISASNGLVVDE